MRSYGLKTSIFFGHTKRYDQTVIKLKKTFLAIRDKSNLGREFYSNQPNVFQNAFKFFMHKLDL